MEEDPKLDLFQAIEIVEEEKYLKEKQERDDWDKYIEEMYDEKTFDYER